MRLLLASVLLVTACGEDELFCTLIGCSDSLTLNLATPADGARVRLRGDGVDATCDVPAASAEVRCSQTITLTRVAERVTVVLAAAPAELTVEVVDAQGAGTATETVRPDYEVNQPNGPECDPTCRNAVLDLEL